MLDEASSPVPEWWSEGPAVKVNSRNDKYKQLSY